MIDTKTVLGLAGLGGGALLLTRSVSAGEDDEQEVMASNRPQTTGMGSIGSQAGQPTKKEVVNVDASAPEDPFSGLEMETQLEDDSTDTKKEETSSGSSGSSGSSSSSISDTTSGSGIIPDQRDEETKKEHKESPFRDDDTGSIIDAGTDDDSTTQKTKKEETAEEDPITGDGGLTYDEEDKQDSITGGVDI